MIIKIGRAVGTGKIIKIGVEDATSEIPIRRIGEMAMTRPDNVGVVMGVTLAATVEAVIGIIGIQMGAVRETIRINSFFEMPIN